MEDNTFNWYKSAANSNWGGSSRLVIRYNKFYSDTGQGITWIKPGNQYGIWHDNYYEYTGSTPTGYVSWINSNALYYNNTFKNFSSGASYEGYRNYSDYYFPFFVRPKEVYVWGNTYLNMKCGTTDTACWYSANEGTFWMNQPGENGAIHFRAPQPGERLYGFTEYTYPHPLAVGTADTTPPASPSGVTVS